MQLFCFGFGYTAGVLATRLQPWGWQIGGSCRHVDKVQGLQAQGYDACLFDEVPATQLREATHVLLSIPPQESGDSVLANYGEQLTQMKQLQWVGYLSTTGVYGDQAGGWVDETTRPAPANDRSRWRLEAEQAWLASRLPVHIFRLPGIYGPGRSALDAVRAGTARRVEKPGQFFSRIHVQDIARALHASMMKPRAGEIYNIADDMPAPQEEVVTYASRLLGQRPPPLVPFEQADLSEMARSFYGSNRRVRNEKMKCELVGELLYPGYREGLRGIYEGEGA